MPVDPAPAPPPVAAIPHFRKIAFIFGALAAALVIGALQLAFGKP